MKNKKNNSLVVIGSGIKSIAHLSIEASAYIRQSDKVLYSVNEPILQNWIENNNSNAESLDRFMNNTSPRSQSYEAITNYILKNMQLYQHICVVFYGHPTMFATSALQAAIIAKSEGHLTKIMPGISAEDCLFADLAIDPASCGCQSFEATDLLLHQRPIYTGSHLILWQAGIIGAFHSIQHYDNKKGIMLLHNYLKKYYEANQIITLYEASLYPHIEPLINQFPLKNLPDIHLSPLSTLYIPPTFVADLDYSILQVFNANR